MLVRLVAQYVIPLLPVLTIWFIKVQMTNQNKGKL